MSLLLSEEENRLTILPIKHQKVWDAYKRHEAAMWFVHEVKVNRDLIDWEKLNDNERHFIKHILAFFASSDMIVAENLTERFMREVKMTEAKVFYGFQLMMENIHSHMYSIFIDTYITNKDEKKYLFDAVKTIPCIAKKALWAKRWIESQDDFGIRLLAFAIVEGIFFSGAFCSIFWLNERGLMPGLSKGNEFIARDEGLHTDFACLLYNDYIIDKIPFERVVSIITEAVDIEIEFITQALPCKLIGINVDTMIEYIKFVANRLSNQLNYNKIYDNVSQPFPFMDRICLPTKTNFFEGDVSEYQKNDSGGHDDDVDNAFKVFA